MSVEIRRVPTWEEYGDPIRFVQDATELAEWCGGISHLMTQDDEHAYNGAPVVGPYVHVLTPEGNEYARPGQWIVRVSGDFYVTGPFFEAHSVL